jgi:hypothetical protein
MLIAFSWSIREVKATSPGPGVGNPEHDAIPEKIACKLQISLE